MYTGIVYALGMALVDRRYACPFAILIGASDRVQELHFTGASSVSNGHDSVASSPPTELSYGLFLVGSFLVGFPRRLRLGTLRL